MKNVHDTLSPVVANFVLKFPNFRYHGNKGRSDVYFNDNVKLLDLENPRLVQHPRHYLLYKLSFSQFCLKIISNKITRFGLGQILTMPLNCPTPKTPDLVQTACFYL